MIFAKKFYEGVIREALKYERHCEANNVSRGNPWVLAVGLPRNYVPRNDIIKFLSPLIKSKKIKLNPTFRVWIYPVEEGGYWATVPDLQGCNTQGETLKEIEKNIFEVIDLCLEDYETQIDDYCCV